jgi:anti-sigma regulatory factor (Ser/Thr protein kinase)
MKAYDIFKGANKLKIVFPSEIGLLAEIVYEAELFIRKFELPLDLYAFKLILFEGATNAITHGNKSDHSIDVIVSIEILKAEKQLKIRFEDFGKGFDWRAEIEKEEQPLEIPTGRGMLLIKSYGYQPEYNDTGNVLSLTLDITGTGDKN